MDSSHSQNPPASNWQTLGELELPAGMLADNTLHTWLKDVLHPLNLHTDFLNKILSSAQQTAAHILRADGEIKLEHIHLLVLGPSNRVSDNQTWGFFSLERLEETKEGDDTHDHTIEIYLYMEGEDIPKRGNKQPGQ